MTWLARPAMIVLMSYLTSQDGQVVTMSAWPMEPTQCDFEGVSEPGLASTTARLSWRDQARLTEFWSRVIADAGAELPTDRRLAYPARRARRLERQRTGRLVRVLASASRGTAAESSGVAA